MYIAEGKLKIGILETTGCIKFQDTVDKPDLYRSARNGDLPTR